MLRTNISMTSKLRKLSSVKSKGTRFAISPPFWHHVPMNYAIILAAGRCERFNASIKSASHKNSQDKLLYGVAGRPLIYYTLSSLNDHHLVESIILVVNSSNQKPIEEIIEKYKFSKVKKITLGGKTRQESLEKGLAAIKKPSPSPSDIIIVQNGANPNPSYDEITDAVIKAEEFGACIVGRSITSTVKKIKGKKVEQTLDRKSLFAAETPQVSKFNLLQKALLTAKKRKFEATDEAMLLELIKIKPEIAKASENNFKITTEADLERLKSVLGETPESFRVGIGQDSHIFSKTEKGLTLAGVLFKDQSKLEANSDGDVILHAIFNALSQAIGDKSLGFYADPLCIKYNIKDSAKFLEPLLKKIKENKYEIHNLGVMLECKFPKIDKLNSTLKQSLSAILKVDVKKIGITATSGENATIFGQGLGIQCFAIVSLARLNAKTKGKK